MTKNHVKSGEYAYPKKQQNASPENSPTPSKFEQFINLDFNSLNNPYIQRKSSNMFEADIKKHIESSMPRSTSHFTQSAIYNKKSQ